MRSYNPANGEIIWEQEETTEKDLQDMIHFATKVNPIWRKTPLNIRIDYLKTYAQIIKREATAFSLLISKETGKPLYESIAEVTSMYQKIDISINAYEERCKESLSRVTSGTLSTQFQAYGVVAVLGPFNFPGHLPNGHIVPALLAGNCVIFKPSELTPAVGEKMDQFMKESGFPPGVFQTVYGGPLLGEALVTSHLINGVYFTGSFKTGVLLNKTLAAMPGKILALELGGNNPLVISDISDRDAAVYNTILSAFITTGQRCTCARRLILVNSKQNQAFLDHLIHVTSLLRIGAYDAQPEPFMGPLINLEAAKKLLHAQDSLIKNGGKPLLLLDLIAKNNAFITPGIIDVTDVNPLEDEEFFGPFLQVQRVSDFQEALMKASATQFGLAASLFSTSKTEWELFRSEIKAGILNWNTPTTGASSLAPFGGVKNSGNGRPSGFLAADYCSYPVASIVNSALKIPEHQAPGINL